MGGDFVQRLVVPHLGFGEHAPAIKWMMHRGLAAQGFHRAVANKVVHFLVSNLSAPK
jgi:hypothetical protein